MKVSTNSLKGKALEWVIAQIEGDTCVTCPKCEGEGSYTKHGTGWTEQCSCKQCGGNGTVDIRPGSPLPEYLTSGHLFKHIVQKHKLDIKWLPRQQEWCVTAHQHRSDGFTSGMSLSSDLSFAVMNALAQHKHGDFVEIPEELHATMMGS